MERREGRIENANATINTCVHPWPRCRPRYVGASKKGWCRGSPGERRPRLLIPSPSSPSQKSFFLEQVTSSRLIPSPSSPSQKSFFLGQVTSSRCPTGSQWERGQETLLATPYPIEFEELRGRLGGVRGSVD